jgi:hypothetical protein
MSERKITLEEGLFIAAFTLALSIRMAGLGILPLSEQEAGWALQAWKLTHAGHLVGPQPAYLISTAGLFALLGSGDFLARFIPALIGSFLPLAPSLFRDWLGRRTVLILAFVFALEPTGLALSRQVGGEILGIVSLVFALGWFLKKRYVLGGICLGVVFLSGPLFLPALLGLTLALLWTYLARRKESGILETPFIEKKDLPLILAGALGAILLIGTGFFMVPSGISGFASSLVTYFQGWKEVGDFSALHILTFLPVYVPMALILGIWGAVQGLMNHDEKDIILSRWSGIAFLLALLYPGHQGADLAWCILPLWVLAARQMDRCLDLPKEDSRLLLGLATLIAILLTFVIMNIAWFVNPNQQTADVQLRYVAVAGGLLFICLVTVLVAWGWALRPAWYGFCLGFGVILLAYSLSASWNAAGMGRQPKNELWRTSPYLEDRDLLLKSIHNISEWSTGINNSLDVKIVNLPSQALQWELRDWKNVEYVDQLDMGATPDLILTSDQKDLALSVAYTGQDLVWREVPIWQSMNAVKAIQWLFYREIPTTRSTLVLWVRSELFPGAGKGQ